MKLKSYIVVKGDNLTKIAKANSVDVKDLIAANKNIKDPNLILVGQKINIPKAETETLHISTRDAAEATIKRQQQLKADKIHEGQLAAAKQAEAERRQAGTVSEQAKQNLQNKMSSAKELQQNRQAASAHQAEAERRQAGQISPETRQNMANRAQESQATHERQAVSARQAELERRNAGTVTQETRNNMANRAQEVQNRQAAAARQAEAERRQAGTVTPETRQNMANRAQESQATHERQAASARQAEAERRQAGTVKPNENQTTNNSSAERQAAAARQAEAERRQAGTVTQETKDAMAARAREREALQERQAASARQAEEERRNAGIVNPEIKEAIFGVDQQTRLDNLFESLDGRDFSGKNGGEGECGRLAKVLLQKLDLVEDETANSHGISFASNLAENGNVKFKNGYKAVGLNVLKDYSGRGGASTAFDELIKNKFGAIAISFNSTGHYDDSGVHGHVIVVSGYDPTTNKVYLVDNYDSKWKKGTTSQVYSLEDFKKMYFEGGNTVNYMTAVVPKDTQVITKPKTQVDAMADLTYMKQQQHVRQTASAQQAELERKIYGEVSPEAKIELQNNRVQEQIRINEAAQQSVYSAMNASKNLKIPRVGSDGLIVLEKSDAGQKVINKLFYEIPSHANGTHSAELDKMIDNLSAEECAWVLTRIEDRGFGQTGAGYAGQATPQSHEKFIQQQVIERFGGDIHNVLKSWGTHSYTGY